MYSKKYIPQNIIVFPFLNLIEFNKGSNMLLDIDKNETDIHSLFLGPLKISKLYFIPKMSNEFLCYIFYNFVVTCI